MRPWTHPDAQQRVVRAVLPQGRAIVVGPGEPIVQLDPPETYGLPALGWRPVIETQKKNRRKRHESSPRS